MVSRSLRYAAPAAGELHVWRIPLGGDPTRHITSLSMQEFERLACHRGERRECFALSHGAAREVLGAYLDCRPAEVPLECAYGKPPSVPGLALSLTHTDGLALLAVARRPVGVDVELSAHGDDDDLEDLAQATLAPPELRAFAAAAAAERPGIWLRAWVRKEAALKASGRGLGDRALSELDVSDDRVGELTLVDLNVGPEYAAAIASTTPVVEIRLEEWSDDSR